MFNGSTRFDTNWHPVSVASGDFDNDGNLDLVSATSDYQSLKVFYGYGNTTFRANYDYYDAYRKQCVVVDDFNGDEKLDFAVALYDNNTVSLYLGNSANSFNMTRGFQTGINPYAMVTGDFNNDSNADIAVANYGNSSISILLGRANSTFAATVHYSVGLSPTSIATGKLNTDNYLDLVVTNFASHTISVLLGNGDGTFKTANTFQAGYNQPRSIAVADMDKNGISDIVVGYVNSGSSKLGILLGKCDGTFYLPTRFYDTTYAPNALSIADFNGDSRDDIVVLNSDSNQFTIFLNVGP